MPTFTPQIAYCLERFREGDAENAFHSLTEMDHASIPELIAEFQAATDAELKAFLLHVIWQHRQPSVIPLLGEALFSADREVWLEAMDGLVVFASTDAIAALCTARSRRFSQERDAEDFQFRLEEAISQAQP